MFLMEEALAHDGRRLATICMREDGLFEGRVYKLAREKKRGNSGEMHFYDTYEICGVAETLSRIQTIVYEELELDSNKPVDQVRH